MHNVVDRFSRRQEPLIGLGNGEGGCVSRSIGNKLVKWSSNKTRQP